MKSFGDARKGTSGQRESIGGLIARGFLIVFPLVLIGLIVQQLFLAFQSALKPVLDIMPGKVLARPSVRFVAVCLALVLLFLLIGLFARTRFGRALGRKLEPGLNRLPMYSTLRNFASGLARTEGEKPMKAVLVEVDIPGLSQLGLIVERHADRSATVFLPASPNPASGTVVVVVESRIRELDVPMQAVIRCMGRFGTGTAALLEKAGVAPGMSSGGDSPSA
jgi:uncharacterized membrane protein